MPEPEAGQHSLNKAWREASWRIVVSACSGEAGRTELTGLLRNPLNWSAVLSLAEEHGVIAHLAEALSSNLITVPAEVRQELQELRHSQILVSLSMTAELFRLVDKFRKAGIEVLAIKGPLLSARAYGDPGFRQFGDLDFLLRSKDVERGTQTLAADGYEPRVPVSAIRRGKVPGEYLFRKTANQLLVELHTERSLRYFPRALPIDEYFARQARVEIDGHAVPAMAPEDEFVHICVHGTKHMWDRLAWIADVAAILRTNSLDWRRAVGAARRAKATRMLLLGGVLASEILRAPLPQELDEEIRQDRALPKIASEIKRRLPATPSEGLWKRAAYRVSTGGGSISGFAYFCRLAFSTTERDWRHHDSRQVSSWEDVSRRLMRLAKLYGRHGT